MQIYNSKTRTKFDKLLAEVTGLLHRLGPKPTALWNQNMFGIRFTWNAADVRSTVNNWSLHVVYEGTEAALPDLRSIVESFVKLLATHYATQMSTTHGLKHPELSYTLILNLPETVAGVVQSVYTAYETEVTGELAELVRGVTCCTSEVRRVKSGDESCMLDIMFHTAPQDPCKPLEFILAFAAYVNAWFDWLLKDSKVMQVTRNYPVFCWPIPHDTTECRLDMSLAVTVTYGANLELVELPDRDGMKLLQAVVEDVIKSATCGIPELYVACYGSIHSGLSLRLLLNTLKNPSMWTEDHLKLVATKVAQLEEADRARLQSDADLLDIHDAL